MKHIFIMIFVLHAVQVKAEKGELPAKYMAACHQTFVAPLQEKMREFLEENQALEKENKELKAVIKKVQSDLQELKVLNQSIRSDVNNHKK